MEQQALRSEIERVCRRLLSEQNRDRYSSTYGCFDRRFWSWKLVDFPEATFQRNVAGLVWLMGRVPADSGMRLVLAEAVAAGLRYAFSIQNCDGSFNQAFPNERSFGATAFLIDPLLSAYLKVRNELGPNDRAAIEGGLQKAADFLCECDETHGLITNHLAGAVWSLTQCADLFSETRYERRAVSLLQRVLSAQSEEGWFVEYDGADPGYQSLCLHYLAQVAQRRPSGAMDEALGRAVEFLSWCIHPDGSYAGEYGSRRTAIYYPGGIALLAATDPLARTMTRFMTSSLVEGRTVGLGDVDMGNTAPVLSSWTLLLDALEANADNGAEAPLLPWQRPEASRDFAAAGLHMRAIGGHYTVVGASNGGVLKVFDRQQRRIVWDDGGYVGESANGERLTTQTTSSLVRSRIAPERVELDADFFHMGQPLPTPARFVLLRVLNLTVMHSIRLGNAVKAILVKLLIKGGSRAPLRLSREVTFSPEAVTIKDRLHLDRRIELKWLEFGRPFVAIHMASSRYFPGFAATATPSNSVDVGQLQRQGFVENTLALRT